MTRFSKALYVGIFSGLLTLIIFGVIIVIHNRKNSKKPKSLTNHQLSEEAIKQNVAEVFNEAFKEELRNRGRLHFEKIISENAMFLQQDLQLTTSQLNEYLKNEVTKNLQSEFKKYEQSLEDARQLAIEAIQKTNQAIDKEREVLSNEIQKQIDLEKQQVLENFQNHLATIVNRYILAAIGDQIDLNDQLAFIVADLEKNKEAIKEDVIHGA